MPGTVMVFARESDRQADALVRELRLRGARVFRMDTARSRQHVILDAHLDSSTSRWTGMLSVGARAVRLDDIVSVWCAETQAGVDGVLAALPVLWVNHPRRAADAGSAALQLATAATCGLHVAQTLITNSPAAAARFVGVHRSAGTVVGSAGQLRRAVGEVYVARVVVIGEHLFTIAIHRNGSVGRLRLVDVPPDVEQGLRRYLDRLGLVCVVADFAVDRHGRHWFLESRSIDRCGWLEARTGVPVTAAVAELLVRSSQ